ncbi:MAG: HEPN domain-containing protein [Candidatus Thorarchaeota archaeon]|nr:HEPN domain-containing protein [Candidatus Thorarchaeota archaeon]
MVRSLKFRELARRSYEEGSHDFASFFAQQAVEFYVKGLLIRRIGAKVYSHSLVVLIDTLAESGVSVPSSVRDCIERLGEHYIQARYPDARMTDYSQSEAREALRCMEVTLDFLATVG